MVFGAERTGLTNEELQTAHALVRIPASSAYAALNLAMAVQLVAYELFRACHGAVAPRTPADAPLATAQELERLYAHFAQVLEEIDFRDRTQSGTHLMGRIRRFLQRAELDENEVQHPARHPHGGAEPAAAGGRYAMSSAPVYLDYAATTPVDARVAQAMGECLTQQGDFANASSVHGSGARAAARIEQARAQVAALLGVQPAEIVFTSGATESNNLAILGCARANADRGRHIVTVRTEHKSVLDPCRRLEREGFSVTWLTPARSGRLDPQSFAAALRPDTVLVVGDVRQQRDRRA